jgi:multidrug efflux pump subunit AcrA (membrane-fusion protein)
MKRTVALLVCLAVAGCGKQKEEEASPVVTVDVAPVLQSQIQRTIRADGLVYPRQQAAIVPRVAAPIRETLVQRGAKVKAGQVLVQLENRDLEGSAAESRATYDQAQATFETASMATVPEELQKAELDARAAKDAFDAAQAVYENRQRLFKEGAIAEKEVNDSRASMSAARTSYETAQKRLQDLEGFGRDQELKAAAAQRDAARGRLDSAQAQLGYSRLTSPIAGVVTDLPYYVGETPPSGQPVVTVMDLSQVIARTHVAPNDAAELKVGNDANIIGPDGIPHPGKVSLVSPALDAANSSVEVWVQADNPDGALRAGTSVKVEMIARTVMNALVIPDKAVLTGPDGTTFAMVIDQNNVPHRRKITAGIRDSGKAQVTDGLDNGQRVATTGAFELFKLDADVLSKTKVQIAPPKEEEEVEES